MVDVAAADSVVAVVIEVGDWAGIGVPAAEPSDATRLLRPIGEGGVTGSGVDTGVGATAAGAGIGATTSSDTGAETGAGAAIGVGAGASTGGVEMDGVGARLGEAVAGWEVALAPGRNLGGKGNGAGREAGVATAATLLATRGTVGL